MIKKHHLVEKKIVNQVVLLLALGIIILAASAYLNFTARNNIAMGVMCIITSIAFILLAAYLLASRNHRRVYFPALLFLSIHILSYLVLGAERDMGVAWILILPLISFYTQGLLAGSIYSGLLLSAVLVINWVHRLKGIIQKISPEAYLEGVVIFIVITILTFIYERSSQMKEQIIFKQHNFDGLTGLPNRRKLIQDIAENRENTLILINIDDFKEINNFFGVSGGDKVLKEVAARYSDQFEPSEFNLYKLHADEFALLLRGKRDVETAVALALEIHTIMDRDIEFEDTDLIVSVSIGISDGSDLLTTADIALKSSKRQKVSYYIFTQEVALTKTYEENILRLYRIQKGIKNDAFVPYFQPIYDLTTNRIQKYECLIRLRDANEILLPSQFIDISKRSKKYHHLTRMMVTKSFEYFQHRNYDFSINLCQEDLESPETTAHIYAELERFKIGEKVIFEFLESERIEDNPEVIHFIAMIRKFNCRTAIDDFGSGYSNFDFILRMKFDFLKIDATLIKRVNVDNHAQIMISTIVKFSKDMGIKTIAEYVHEEDIFNKVKELNVDFAQGFYIGTPQEDVQEQPLFLSVLTKN